MDARGAEPSEEARDLIRQAAYQAIDPRPEWLEEFYAGVVTDDEASPVAADPVLAEGSRRASLANLLHWARSNVEHPGEPVEPSLGQELLTASRDLVRRGLDSTVLEAWRNGQEVAWRRWMEICFESCDDLAILHEVLAITSRTISDFASATIQAVAEQMRRERTELTEGTHAERRTLVSLIIEGAPIAHNVAEAQFGYRLTGSHIGAIVWGTSKTTGDNLERAAEALVHFTGVRSRLTIPASESSLWAWLPTAKTPAPEQFEKMLNEIADVKVALGRPRLGADGFRKTHLEAAVVQRMLTRLSSPRTIASYEDVQLVALMSHDPVQADEFVSDTLGSLATAEPELLTTLSVYLHSSTNIAKTAERLYLHRNTVVRRLSRCRALLPGHEIHSNLTAVSAALELLQWRGASMSP